MTHVLVIYDIPEALKLPNPSPCFRRFGARLNMSCWCFPEGQVPAAEIDRLRDAGATVEIIRFAPEDQAKILDLVRREMRRHLRKVLEDSEARCALLRGHLDANEKYGDRPGFLPSEAAYRRWRSVLARARREVTAAEQCALGFALTGDVQDACDALKGLLAAQLGAALAWRDRRDAPAVFPLALVPGQEVRDAV